MNDAPDESEGDGAPTRQLQGIVVRDLTVTDGGGNASSPPPAAAPAASAGGAFEVFLDQDGAGSAINLRLKPRQELGGDVPTEQASLAAEILGVERDLACIFDGAKWRARERSLYLRELKDIAEIGIAARVPQVRLAAQMLDGLKREIVMREAGPFKAKTMRKLGKWAAILGGGAVAIALLAEGLDSALGATPPTWLNDPDYPLIRALALLVAGCSAGVWLSVGIRQPTVEFDELAKADQDRLGPGIRLAFAAALTLVLAAMFHARVLQVAIGQVSSTEVFTSPLVAILIGVFCGLSEQALSARVVSQANQFVRGPERTART